MLVEENPRPNYTMVRCCGNCKFFLTEHATYKEGRCILPDGPKMIKKNIKELKDKLSLFKPTHVYCYCDNHQWKPIGYLRRPLKYSGLTKNDIK